MYFVICEPGLPGSYAAMIRRKTSEFTPATVGRIVAGPFGIPTKLHLLFRGELLERLPVDPLVMRLIQKELQEPAFEWPMRMKFIVEALILQGWQQSTRKQKLEHVLLGLPDVVKEWMNDLAGAQAVQRILPLFQQTREAGYNAHRKPAKLQRTVPETVRA